MGTIRAGVVAIIAVLISGVAICPAGAWGQSATKILHVFTWGSGPSGPLARDSAGNLYGTTQLGGDYNVGLVFKMVPSASGTWSTIILHSFANAGGAVPAGGVILDASGNLYGTASSGGNCSLGSGCGVVFTLTHQSSGSYSYRVIHTFAGSDGATPKGTLLFDPSGDLLGATSAGGSSTACGGGCGVVFKLTNSSGSWTENVIHSFSLADGSAPTGRLLLDASGNLYGTTRGGGAVGWGTVWQLVPSTTGGWTEHVLHSFAGATGDGEYPNDGVVFSADDNLYGTAENGGTSTYDGLVFELTPNADGTWTEKVIHNFSGPDGSQPYSGLSLDSLGNLYGTANAGKCGPSNIGGGVVFKLSPVTGGWTESTVHCFAYTGVAPESPVFIDPVGNLYGTTFGYINGSGHGIVYEIIP